MTETTELLQTFSIYAPPSVARQAFRNPHRQPGGTWRRFHAATAFADISGFTPLAEELATGGVRGAVNTRLKIYGGFTLKSAAASTKQMKRNKLCNGLMTWSRPKQTKSVSQSYGVVILRMFA